MNNTLEKELNEYREDLQELIGICLENDEDEYIVDENDEYSLIYKYDGSGTYELRDSHNKVIGITEYDTIEEALEDIRNKLGR